MQKILLSLFLSFIFSIPATAQKSNQPKDSAFAINAQAIILLDSGHSSYNENFDLIFTHTTKN